MNINTSRHGARRMKRRLKTSKKNAEAQAFEAFQNGVRGEIFYGSLGRWIYKVYFTHEKSQLIIWHRFLWIFSLDDKLITCYPVPGRLISGLDKQLKKIPHNKTKVAD